MGGVIISNDIKKTSARIDPSGNVIDARTKQVIEPVQTEYVPPAEPIQNAPQAPTANGLSIQQQIDEAKANLLKLEELKKLKIAEMEAQLELLKQ